MDEARFHDELRRYWDEIARGEPATPGDLDPEVAATIQRVHALQDVPAPTANYVQRLREDLMHAASTPLTVTPKAANNGRSPSHLFQRSVPPLARPAPRSWALTQLLTAALVVATLVMAVLVVRAPWGAPPPDQPEGLPVLIAPPQAVDELIARAEVTELGPYVYEYTGINRFVLDPGESVTFGPESEWGDALYLFLVESGTVGMTVDGPAVLGRGEEGAATPIASDAEVILTAGDRGAVQPGTPGTWRNAGSEPAILLEAPIGEAVDTSSLGIEYKEVVYDQTIAWSQFPAVFALHRLTFEPGASLPVSDLPGLMMLGVDAGSLDVSLQTGQGTATRTRDFDAGEGLKTDDWQIAPDGEFRNSGAEPAVVYALLGESAGSAATPTP